MPVHDKYSINTDARQNCEHGNQYSYPEAELSKYNCHLSRLLGSFWGIYQQVVVPY